MDGRDGIFGSALSSYFFQYRGIGGSSPGSQASYGTESSVHQMPIPSSRLPLQSPQIRGFIESTIEGESLSQSSGSSTNYMHKGETEMVKRKRGRPRKYKPDETTSLGLSPLSPVTPTLRSNSMLGSVSTSMTEFGNQLQKRGRGRPPGTGKKQQLASLGEWIAGSAGMGFIPHVITTHPGEDIAARIMSFSQQGPRAVCILSANGSVSTVTLNHPTNSSGTATYRGHFEILCLSGSYLLAESDGSRARSGGLSISLSYPDNKVIGGSIAGALIAATTVQVIVGSFIYGRSKTRIKTKSAEDSEHISGERDISGSSAPNQNLIPSVSDRSLVVPGG